MELNKNFEDAVGIDTRYNPTDAQPEWSVRGADSWNPFNFFEKGTVTAIFNNAGTLTKTVYFSKTYKTIPQVYADSSADQYPLYTCPYIYEVAKDHVTWKLYTPSGNLNNTYRTFDYVVIPA